MEMRDTILGLANQMSRFEERVASKIANLEQNYQNLNAQMAS
jgi:hypothetical protein